MASPAFALSLAIAPLEICRLLCQIPTALIRTLLPCPLTIHVEPPRGPLRISFDDGILHKAWGFSLMILKLIAITAASTMLFVLPHCSSLLLMP